MRNLFIILGLLTCNYAEATTLVINNKTNSNIRIVEISNKCDGYILSKNFFIESNKKLVINNVRTIVHTFLICGSGFCNSSAVGMYKDNHTQEYSIDVTLDKNGLLETNQVPDVWPGNLEC